MENDDGDQLERDLMVSRALDDVYRLGIGDCGDHGHVEREAQRPGEAKCDIQQKEYSGKSRQGGVRNVHSLECA